MHLRLVSFWGFCTWHSIFHSTPVLKYKNAFCVNGFLYAFQCDVGRGKLVHWLSIEQLTDIQKIHLTKKNHQWNLLYLYCASIRLIGEQVEQMICVNLPLILFSWEKDSPLELERRSILSHTVLRFAKILRLLSKAATFLIRFLWCLISSIVLLYVNNSLIWVYFYFSKGILAETSQTKSIL